MLIYPRQVRHDIVISLYVADGSIGIGQLFSYVRTAFIDCKNGTTHNEGACVVDIVASVFFGLLTGGGLAGIYYFAPFAVNQRRDVNGTLHYSNLTHLAPEPLPYFYYGYYANAPYESAHHQELDVNGMRVPSKIWGNTSIGSFEFDLSEVMAKNTERSLSTRVWRSTLARRYPCNGYIRTDLYYNNLRPQQPANNRIHAKELSPDLLNYLVKGKYDGGCFYIDSQGTDHAALVSFKAGCNKADVSLPLCRDPSKGGVNLINLGTTSLAKRAAKLENDAKPEDETIVGTSAHTKDDIVSADDSSSVIEGRASGTHISWGALCFNTDTAVEVCRCWAKHNVKPSTRCRADLCQSCDFNPLSDRCIARWPLTC